jgi:hypothetical protein
MDHRADHSSAHSNGRPRDREGGKKVDVHPGDGTNRHATHGHRAANTHKGKPRHKVKHHSPRAKEHKKAHKGHGHHGHKGGGGSTEGGKKGHDNSHNGHAGDNAPGTQDKPLRRRDASGLPATEKKPSAPTDHRADAVDGNPADSF